MKAGRSPLWTSAGLLYLDISQDDILIEYAEMISTLNDKGWRNIQKRVGFHGK
jgi:hypothetical protein